MKWVILPTFYRVGLHSGESYSKLWKWMSWWTHLDLQFRYIFCGVRLTETRNTEVQDCIDPTTSFYWVGPHSGESYSKLWKWMSCWTHLDLQFRYIFCGVRLTETQNTEVQDCIDPTASDLEWKVSFPHHSWSLKNQAVHRGFTSRPVCCLSYAMIYIDPGETLIFATLLSTTVPCSSLSMIILYGGSPLSSSRINHRQAICMVLC